MYNYQIPNSGQPLIDLRVAPPGLLGPVRHDIYGPSLHSDATGRPFFWRTQDGSMSFGSLNTNGYGLGVWDGWVKVHPLEGSGQVGARVLLF